MEMTSGVEISGCTFWRSYSNVISGIRDDQSSNLRTKTVSVHGNTFDMTVHDPMCTTYNGGYGVISLGGDVAPTTGSVNNNVFRVPSSAWTLSNMIGVSSGVTASGNVIK